MNEELELETPAGQRKAVLHSATPLHDERGILTGAVVSVQDVSQLRRLEREADERAQQLDAIFESMTDGVFVYDTDGNITRANAAGRRILGPDADPDGRPMRERAASCSRVDAEGHLLPYE